MVCLWLVKYSNLCRIIFNTKSKCSETVLQLGIIWLVGRFEKPNTAASCSFWDDGKRATSATSMTRLTTTA